MKLRVIDSKLVPAIRRPVDKTWEVFANHLISAFGDITQQNGFSREDVQLVYCPQRLREVDEKFLDSMVYNVPPAYIPPGGLMDPVMAEDYANIVIDAKWHWRASKDSPFLLLGYVGTGKTMFLDYYFYHHLPTSSPDVRAVIVDFKRGQDNDIDFVLHMLDKVDACLADIHPCTAGRNRATMERLYASEVSAFRNSLRDPTLQEHEIDKLFASVIRSRTDKDTGTYAQFIGRKIRDYKSQGKTLWIVLDNIDQHFHCLHHQAFVNTVAIANQWECPLIISMRYVTLHTPGARRTYDSFRPRTLRLSLPNVESMLLKRLEFFKLLADLQLESPLGWTANVLNVRELAQEIQKSITLLCRPSFLSGTLLPLSNYNLRRLLDILLSCFQSYYFFFDRFNNERYPPNEHSLLKRFIFSHLLKNNEYFDPSSRTDQDQFIVNLFENENPTAPYNQTIRIRLLQVLMYFGRGVPLSRLDKYFQAVFLFERHDLLASLRAFLERDLISFKNVLSPNFDTSLTNTGFQEAHLSSDDIQIALTWAGRLHYDLLFQLEYLEIMKFSTYVDPGIYFDVQDPSLQSKFESRARSTRKFVDYLVRQEEDEVNHWVRDKTRFAQQLKRVMPEVSLRIARKLDEIQSLPEHRGSKS